MNIKKIWVDSDVLDITDIDTIKEQLYSFQAPVAKASQDIMSIGIAM